MAQEVLVLLFMRRVLIQGSLIPPLWRLPFYPRGFRPYQGEKVALENGKRKQCDCTDDKLAAYEAPMMN